MCEGHWFDLFVVAATATVTYYGSFIAFIADSGAM
jgi:hypothetical protein